MFAGARSLSIGARAIASAALLVLAVAAIGSGLDREAENEDAFADWVPRIFAEHALEVKVNQKTRERRLGDAAELASALVARAPVEPGNTALLGSVYLIQGNQAKADSVFTTAAQFGWRSVATQAYWMDRAIVLGDYDVAAMRLDALLRTDHSLQRNFALLSVAEKTPEMRKALLTRMAVRPPWLSSYVSDVSDFKGAQFESRVQMLEAMSQAGLTAGCVAISPVVNQLTSRNALLDGNRLWRAHCPQARTVVTDPGFAFLGVDANETTIFGWQAQTSGSLSYERARSDKHILAITNVGPTTAGFIKQLVVTPPGDYRIRWYSSNAKDGRQPAVVPHFGCELLAIAPVEGITSAGSGWWTAPLKIDSYCPAHWLDMFVSREADGVLLGGISIEPASPR